MPFVRRWDGGDVRLALCVQDGGQVAVSLSVVRHSGGYLSDTDTTPCVFLSDYLDECPPYKMLYAYRPRCFKGEAEHVIYSMEKLDWMLDDYGNPQWRVTEGDQSWSDFDSSDELLHRVQSLYEQPTSRLMPYNRVLIFEHTSGIVFICGENEYGFDEMMFELLGEKRAPSCGMCGDIGSKVFLFGSSSDNSHGEEGSLIQCSEEEGSEEEGSEEEGSEEESEDEDAGEEFRSGKYGKLEGTLYGALELGAWTSFTYLEASDECSKHIHSWAFGDVCGDLVIIRILRGEKAGGASATPQKCYVALLWDLSRNNWAYRTLPQLGPPTAAYTDQPDMLTRFESKLRKFEPPSVAAALSQAARASNSAKKARHS